MCIIFIIGKIIIQALPVKCANVSNGCEWRGTVDTLDNHVSTCTLLKVDDSPHTPGRQCSESDLKCYVFVDYSNLRVSGQKEYGKKLIDTNIDHRFRVDLGKVLQQVSNDRHISKAFFYGSIPSTFWITDRDKSFKVIIKHYEGKEANVAMARDILLTLHNLSFIENKENVVLTVITGDRKFRPLIEETLHCGVPVELWSWRDALSQEFSDLASTHKTFTVNYLNSVSDHFSFIAYMSTRDKKDIDPSHAIVYRDVPVDERFLQMLINHLVQLKRLFYITSIVKQTEGEKDLIVEFPESNPDVVLTEIRKLGIFSHQSCSFPEYTMRKEKIEQPIPTTNRYGALSTLDEDYITSGHIERPSTDSEAMENMGDTNTTRGRSTSQNAGENDTESSTDWRVELRRQPGKMTHMKRRKETPCLHGDHCQKAAQCHYLHTEEEKKLFAKHPDVNFKYFKTQDCYRKAIHTSKESKKRCTYAHDNRDSWCLKCNLYCHLTKDCPF